VQIFSLSFSGRSPQSSSGRDESSDGDRERQRFQRVELGHRTDRANAPSLFRDQLMLTSLFGRHGFDLQQPLLVEDPGNDDGKRRAMRTEPLLPYFPVQCRKKSLEDKKIVTLTRFAAVMPAAPSCANKLCQTRRACAGKSLGTWPAIVCGTWPLIKSSRAAPDTATPCE
jgi:hypothetical protein